MKEKQENAEGIASHIIRTEDNDEINSQIDILYKKVVSKDHECDIHIYPNYLQKLIFGEKSMVSPHFGYTSSKKRNTEEKNNFSTVDVHTKDFILKQNVYLISAYKMRDSGTEQRYALALKEDNEANRDVFLDFMLEHNDTEVGKTFPISFRFVRAELIKKAGGLEPIITEPKAA